jgi:two-component system NtrC family response regulator
VDLELEVPESEVVPATLRQIREDAERQALEHTLNLVEGNLSRAAELLGITRPTLYTLLDKYQMRGE